MQQFKSVCYQAQQGFSSQKLGQQMITRQDFDLKPFKFTALMKSF